MTKLEVDWLAYAFLCNIAERQYRCECDEDWHIERLRPLKENPFTLMEDIEILKTTASYLRTVKKQCYQEDSK